MEKTEKCNVEHHKLIERFWVDMNDPLYFKHNKRFKSEIAARDHAQQIKNMGCKDVKVFKNTTIYQTERIL